jgi:flagellar hook-basal body complex protein FliE
MVLPVPPIGGASLPTVAEPASPSGSGGGGGFAKALEGAMGKLDAAQSDAATQARQLATGQASDVSSVVMSVEKASLEVQLAAQIRNKLVEDYQDIFRMQV